MSLNQLSIALLFSIIPLVGISQDEQGDQKREQSNPRLDVEVKNTESSLIDLEGFVTSRSKYSFEIDTGEMTRRIKVGKDVAIKLRVTSPRIDFEEKQLIIDVEGAEKRFRGYPIPDPLYIRVNFVHKKQIQRIAAQEVKRISGFELSDRPLTRQNKLDWVGELKKGESNRQLKLKSGAKEYDVLLAKRGEMSGFSIADLKKGFTKVRVSGRLGADGQIEAKRILYWPAIKKDPSVTPK